MMQSILLGRRFTSVMTVEAFVKWKDGLIGSVSDIVASGHVPPFARERFNPPSNSHPEKSEAMIGSGKTLVGLIGEKEHAQIDVEKANDEFRRKINDLYFKLDKKIATVLAVAQLDKVMGFSHQMDQEKALGMGIRAFVMKPLVLREVAGTVRNVLDAARM